MFKDVNNINYNIKVINWICKTILIIMLFECINLTIFKPGHVNTVQKSLIRLQADFMIR